MCAVCVNFKDRGCDNYTFLLYILICAASHVEEATRDCGDSSKPQVCQCLLTFSKSEWDLLLSMLKLLCIYLTLFATGSMWAPQTRVDIVLLNEVKLLEGSSRQPEIYIVYFISLNTLKHFFI